jgi:tetratricopeptide (TPR) repeat protein
MYFRYFASVIRTLLTSCLVVTTLGYLTVGATTWAQTPTQTTRDILRQAALYQNQFRTGNLDIFPEYVVLLQQATTNTPDNAELWYAMSVASFAQAAATVMAGGKMADVGPAYQQGQAALERALQLNPEHAEALALRGGTRLMLAMFIKAPETAATMTAKGIADMNHAVDISPTSERARLQRAFSGLTLPETLRNNAAEAEDLEFLMKVAGNSRAGDYIKIMRGDLHAELGQTDQARALYRRVETSTSPAAAEAKARLAALDQGGVSVVDIKALRSAAGAQCVMCHGN